MGSLPRTLILSVVAFAASRVAFAQKTGIKNVEAGEVCFTGATCVEVDSAYGDEPAPGPRQQGPPADRNSTDGELSVLRRGDLDRHDPKAADAVANEEEVSRRDTRYSLVPHSRRVAPSSQGRT